ncbi:MAG: hypothetical protein HY372_02140, partial [Candidatus Andersenbacteria bacterium]|nr:hypothetical protein [Candidatus Andersenbacteria bacterium]
MKKSGSKKTLATSRGWRGGIAQPEDKFRGATRSPQGEVGEAELTAGLGGNPPRQDPRAGSILPLLILLLTWLIFFSRTIFLQQVYFLDD